MSPLDLEMRGPKLLTLLAAVFAIASGVGSCATVIAAKVGVSVAGVPDVVERVDTRIRTDSLLTQAQINANALALKAQNERITKLEQLVEIWTYIQCVDLRRRDPDLQPPGCTSTLHP